MTTRRDGAPCWADLMTSDTGGARSFYAEVLGWACEEPNADFGGYANFLRDGERIAGLMDNADDPQRPVVWSLYLATHDIEATLAAAKDHGGEVVVPAMPVGDMGTMAFLVDPGGAGIGLWQPGTHTGFAAIGETGAPAWFELHTTAWETSTGFYRDVFGLDVTVVSDTDDFRYAQLCDPELDGDEAGLAGVMDGSAHLGDGIPSHWAIYFAVDDADAAVARVTELGGGVLQPPEDTPYGRLAVVADPAGAAFRLVAG